MSTISRRRVLSGAATAGLGLPLLAACGDDGPDSTGADPSTPASDTTPPTPPTSSKPTATRSAGSSAPAGEGIPTSDVPVGGGIVLPEEQVVLTQPVEGEFHAFSSICTHANCPVARVKAEIECDCHGSRFSIQDGSVAGGPATSPLAAADFSVSGDRITLR